MKVSLYNTKQEVIGEVDLPDEIFGVKWNPDLVHQTLVAQLANRRRPWAHVKDRSAVRGGGKKPWRQKGTGRARHGSIRSPLWRGGGVTFGPTNERVYSQKINKKMKRGALHSLLSRKLRDGDLKIVDSLGVAVGKTRELRWLPSSVLVIPGKSTRLVLRAIANRPRSAGAAPPSLNVYDLLRYQHIFIEKEAAATFGKK